MQPKAIPLALLLLAPLASLQAAPPSAAANPEVWMMPPGRCFKELFANPEQWKETRAQVGVIGYADHVLNKYSDQELESALPKIQALGLKLGLEVGAIKPWGQTGADVFQKQRRMWDRFQSKGAKIYAIAMDEPLCTTRFHLKKTDEYAVEETASFISLVRHNYPAIRIGDIEGYPSVPLKDLIAWIDALQARLKKANVRGLDFFRVDVDWTHFIVGHPGNWGEMKQLEDYCRAKHIAFSMIYWAADYPAMKKKGFADDSSWYTSIMTQGNAYVFVNGVPDEYVIESWVDAPSASLPETEPWTFTRSVLDFSKKFVKPLPPAH